MKFERPEFFTVGARVNIRYRSPRDTIRETKSVSGEIVDDGKHELIIEEIWGNEDPERVNAYRTIRVDTKTLEVYSETDQRTTLLGAVDEISLSVPPWESSADELATGWVYLAIHQNQMVHEGPYSFPDPDFMEQPDGWSSDD